MMMNGSRSDSAATPSAVDEQHREHQHQQELPECARLLFDLRAEADREVGRHADLAPGSLGPP